MLTLDARMLPRYWLLANYVPKQFLPSVAASKVRPPYAGGRPGDFVTVFIVNWELVRATPGRLVSLAMQSRS